jgi:hypothetical protein
MPESVADDTQVDFRKLTPEEDLDLTLFEDYLRLHATPLADVETLINASPEQQFFLLGLSDSDSLERLSKKYSNAVYWTDGYKKKEEDKEFKLRLQTQGLNLKIVEQYVEWLIVRNETIVLVLPHGFFTHFSRTGEVGHMASIKEFDYLARVLPRIDPDKLIITA